MSTNTKMAEQAQKPVAAGAGCDAVSVLMDHAYSDGADGRRLPSPFTETAEAEVRALMVGERKPLSDEQVLMIGRRALGEQ